MKAQFSRAHQRLKARENSEECNVQMPFQGRLRKYIQIEGTEGQDIGMDAGNEKQVLDLRSGVSGDYG